MLSCPGCLAEVPFHIVADMTGHTIERLAVSVRVITSEHHCPQPKAA